MEQPQKLICYNCFKERDSQEGPCPCCGFDLEENIRKYPTALRPGTVLNSRYIVGRVLGQGGFGITYVAYDTQLAAKVAVKEFMPGELAARVNGTTVSVMSADRSNDFAYGAERFKEEARTLAKFMGNPNIAAVTSYFDENDTSYFVMDYIEGISFKTYIANCGGRVSAEDALNVMIPVLRALTAVHAEGFIHRDVTPDNIYITKDGLVKLLDFGSARYSIGDKSKSLDVILKVGYAPKEQYIRRSRQGPYTDVYSCAACFYAALTGFLPPESLERLECDRLVPVSQAGIEIPEYLDRAILKGLAVQPEDRFQDAREFLDAIENQQVVELPEKEGTEGENGAQSPASAAKRRFSPALIAGAAAAAVLLAVGVGYLAGGGGRPGSGHLGGSTGGAAAVQADWGSADGGVTDGSGAAAGGAAGQKGAGSADAGEAAGEAFSGAEAPKVRIAGKEYSAAEKELDLAGAGLTDADLISLKEMTSLTFLSLKDNPQITDLSPLAGLTSLKTLELQNTGASDLSPLSSLTGLTELRIANPDVSDLTPLSSLTELTTLYLDDGDLFSSAITDLSPLAGLKKLQVLCIPPMPNYKDFSCLSGLTELRTLRMMGTTSSGSNSIQSLDFLAGMTKLETLRLVAAGGDLSVISGLVNLKSLSLHADTYTEGTDIFKNLTNLEELSLRNSVIVTKDMSGFSGLTKLHRLNLIVSGIESLAGLESLTDMQEMEISVQGSGSFSDLTPLSGMTKLQRLSLYAGNSSAPLSLEPLRHLSNLGTAELGPASRIGDRSPVEHVQNLDIHN